MIRRCLFLGYQEDVARFYDAFDVLLLPSVERGHAGERDRGARRRAPRRRDAGRRRSPTSSRDGVDGFLVDDGADELAARLEELAADPELRARMGAAGRARVFERYAVDRLVDDVDRLYRRLLAARGLPLPSLS